MTAPRYWPSSLGCPPDGIYTFGDAKFLRVADVCATEEGSCEELLVFELNSTNQQTDADTVPMTLDPQLRMQRLRGGGRLSM